MSKLFLEFKDSFSSFNTSKKILSVLGCFCIVLGFIFILLSFRNEVIDKKYEIIDHTEYSAESVHGLKPGEIRIVKDIDYIEDGVYKVTYFNYFKKLDGKSILEDDSFLSIIDMFGLGYTLNENKVIVNEKVYRINNGLDKNNVSISYEDNMLTINLPSNLSERENKIEFYIKLIGRNVNYKYITSQDSYVISDFL